MDEFWETTAVLQGWVSKPAPEAKPVATSLLVGVCSRMSATLLRKRRSIRVDG